MGRDSAIITVSPIWQLLVSSCALKWRVRRSVRPYRRWRMTRSTATTTVLFILLLATRPILVRLALRVSGIGSHQLALALERFDPRNVFSNRSDTRGVGQLTRR